MSINTPKPTTATEWMEKISDLMGNADKNLDQVKKSIQNDLDSLRKQKDFESLAVNLYQAAETGFKKDLSELGVNGGAQTEYLSAFRQAWEQQEMGKKSSEILESPELRAMDAFITDLENLPKLKEIIASAEPEANWKILLKSITNQIPGMDGLVDKHLGDIADLLGVGWLFKDKTPETDKPATQTATAPATPEEAQASEAAASSAEEGKAPEAVTDGNEVLRRQPRDTYLFGDSNTIGIRGAGREVLKINGRMEVKAEVGQGSGWGLREIKKMADAKPSPLEGMENAVVLFGTNDLLSSPETITDNLRDMYTILKRPGLVKRVFAVTLPPIEGYSGYKDTKANETRESVNDWIRGNGFSDWVIDLCKTESEGGLANNEKPQRIAGYGDGLHVDKKKLAEIYQRELEIGSAALDKIEGKAPSQETATGSLDGALDGHEAVPESFRPGKTLLLGASNYHEYNQAIKERLNVTDTMTKGAQQATWGLSQVKAKPKDYFRQFEYAVIGFGTNDMGSDASADEIWGRFKAMISIMRADNPNLKILISTIPPGKGNPYGQWGSNFDGPGGVEERRKAVNDLIREAQRNGDINGVIDLAATKDKGGVADNSDPQSLTAEYRRFGNDKVHIKADILATAIRRAQHKANN